MNYLWLLINRYFCLSCPRSWRVEFQLTFWLSIFFFLLIFFFVLFVRLMQQSVESVWSMAFDFILDNVQVVVQQTYGSTLKIT